VTELPRRLPLGVAGARCVLGVEFGFEQVHGLEEGFLLAGGELVEDPGGARIRLDVCIS
jgi:hypothetical protein